MEERWRHLAEILVTYSAAVQPGERVMIAMSELETYPLAQEVYAAVVRAGGLPQVQFLSESLRHALLRYGNPDQLAWEPAIEAYGMEWADVYFGLRGAYDPHIHDDIAAEALARNQATQGRISTLRWQKTRWCLVRVPNDALAQQAGMTRADVEAMFFAASLLDWPAVAAEWHRVAEVLGRGRTIRIVGAETDLQFEVAGRRWVTLDGRINMPDGEIMTAPIVPTIQGQILFEQPAVFGGRVIEQIRLRWRDGQLIEAHAATNEEYLQAIVQTDAGAGTIGEFAFGVNPHLTHFTHDILLDEKIGGTIHLALGRAYPECGGTNVSAIHWDIVKDLRGGGTVYLDGVPVQCDGVLLL